MCLRVEDTGIGMSHLKIAELMEEKPPKELLISLGFASSLYIARAIALALGGDLEIYSKVNNGSVFSFWHPISLNEQSHLSEYIPMSSSSSRN
jgi:signal transduction histidine kinase